VYADNDDANENVNDDDDNDNRERRQTHFIDTGVYTRNRIFRLLGSTKFSKLTNAALRIADTNRYPFPIGFDNTKFYRPSMTSGERSSSIDPSDGKCTGDEAAIAVVSLCAQKQENELESFAVLYLNVSPPNKRSIWLRFLFVHF
jgi:hypothetical protein